MTHRGGGEEPALRRRLNPGDGLQAVGHEAVGREGGDGVVGEPLGRGGRASDEGENQQPGGRLLLKGEDMMMSVK